MAILHDQLSALGTDDVRVARPCVRADIGRRIRLTRQRLNGGERFDEPAMRDRLVRRERGAQVRPERLALDVLDEAPPGVRVRQDGDREVAVGDELEQQDVPA
jgi:hypothetical protein